ncbi:RpiB/LacA/LacB family sugar-phosphate isomerase [Paraconexibacter antarcticus]|uniref:RpiB/LacA/LacB family sugar-phosphate isomerase n=1 Tax=Paraconexibacter antarcticus TaxID=2949664 RepID=A0ABY5DZ14_9ACTN|nr:RpiB/LacA/LacB family sugar-phosphate isomerase [Paraconexibacter antarcticus]UTI66436.1 RpiB/LacA/LacB family sugar-phosphate isomerase [Paraconexibacter antarcticus]
MRIAVAFDHAGVPLRDAILAAVTAAGHEADELGTWDDYPVAALAAASAILDRTHERAIVVCGSGAGIAVAATKVRGIRAACCHDTYSAAQCVQHDDVNVLCLGARVIGPALADALVTAFAGATFSGEERHVRRLAQVAAIESSPPPAPTTPGAPS